jgi:CHASE2 domain-containing sensor protein
MDSGQRQRGHHAMDTPLSSVRTYPFMKGAIIIGAVSGLISGLAEANTFTRDLLTLILYSIAGAIIFCAILALVGFLVDTARHRRGPTSP